MNTQQNTQSTTLITPTQSHTARTWVEIDTAALAHNIEQYKSLVHNALFAPVIKSNAYGHGIELVARLCDAHPAVDRMCVVSLSEAVHLRQIGIKKPILVLSIIDAPLEQAVAHDSIVTIYDMPTALELNEIGKQYNKKMSIHIKIDTGLSRLGILAEQAVEFVAAVHKLPNIDIEGIFTHFANSEQEDQTFSRQQLDRLNSVIADLAVLGISIPLRHATCSAAITAHQGNHGTLTRAGIGIYGLWPSQENKEMTAQNHPGFFLKPVLSLKTTIIQIKEIPAHSYVGYDLTFKTDRPTTLAILPVGYWDGYPRALSNNSFVIIHNQRAPIVGRIAMNLMMIDITEVTCAVGDEVILLGNIQGITADDLATRSSTINYEIVTKINPLLPRITV